MLTQYRKVKDKGISRGQGGGGQLPPLAPLKEI